MSEDATEIEPNAPADETGEEFVDNTDTLYEELEEPEEEAQPLAPLSERFAALCIDLTVLAYGVFFVYPFILQQLGQTVLNPLYWNQVQQIMLAGIVATGLFLYFFLFEALLARTPGKLLCRLSVSSTLGGPPSIFGVLLRNLFRFVDLALFPLTGFGLAEASAGRQRLGDLMGATTVRCHGHRGAPLLEGQRVHWATVTRRTITLLLDLILFVATSLFFLLALPTEQKQLTQALLHIGPVLAVAYWVGLETILGGTPAKFLLGLRVVDERIRPIRLPAAFIRTLFRILDHNPLGYLCAILASRKQRPGDLAAGTTVIRTPWSLARLMALLVSLALIASLGYYSIHNPDNFIRTEQQVKIGPWTLPELPGRVKYFLGSRLSINEFYFGRAFAPLPNETTYAPGELVYVSVNVSGFMKKAGLAWLQEDLLVSNAGGETLVDLLNVINKRYELGREGDHTLTSSFLIPHNARPGPWTVRIRVRDAYGQMHGEATGTLTIR